MSKYVYFVISNEPYAGRTESAKGQYVARGRYNAQVCGLGSVGSVGSVGIKYLALYTKTYPIHQPFLLSRVIF